MSALQMQSFETAMRLQLDHAGITVEPEPSAHAPRVVGNVVRYEPGIRALRFVTHYGFGTGRVNSTWDVFDERSDAGARCTIDGSVSMGTFGGSIDDVQEKIGKELARFLKGAIW